MTSERIKRSLSVSGTELDETIALAKALHLKKDPSQTKEKIQKVVSQKPTHPLLARKLSKKHGVLFACLIRGISFLGLWGIFLAVAASLLFIKTTTQSQFSALSALVVLQCCAGALAFYYVLYARLSVSNLGRALFLRSFFVLFLIISYAEVQGVILQGWKQFINVSISRYDMVHVALFLSLISATTSVLCLGVGTEFMVRTKESHTKLQSDAFPRRIACAILGGSVIWLLTFSYLLPPSLGWFPTYF